VHFPGPSFVLGGKKHPKQKAGAPREKY